MSSEVVLALQRCSPSVPANLQSYLQEFYALYEGK
jgi:hypothetical protein